MSMRRGWTVDGKHFAETHTERGGIRYFIDGKPVTFAAFGIAMAAARKAESEKGNK